MGAGDEDVHPRRSVYQSWEVLPGQVLQRLGWGQSASSRQSLDYTGHTAHPTFPLKQAPASGRTRDAPPTAHLQAALLGLIHHLGALLQNAAVHLPEEGHVGLHDIQHFCLILSNHHPKVTWLKQAQNQFSTATSESALWTAGP